MEALGGYYGVTDRLDGMRGSLFWFAFPYRPDFDAEEAFRVADVTEVAAQVISAGGGGGRGGDAAAVRPSNAATNSTSPIWNSSLDGSAEVSGVTTAQNRRTVSRISSQSTSAIKPISLRGLQLTEERIAELRVLVVDDSLTILKMISRTLEQHGFTVETAKNGSIALNKLIEINLKPHMSTSDGDNGKEIKDDGKKSVLSKRFDIVLMDLQMPVMGQYNSPKNVCSLLIFFFSSYRRH
jgi:CheY-like chemotaxis protein